MNKLIIISLVFTGLISLTACDDKTTKKTQNTDSSDSSGTHAPTVIITDVTTDNGDDKSNTDSPSVCEASANPIDQFIRIQSHYGSQLGQPHIAEETGGLLPLNLLTPAAEGDLTLELESTVSLIPGQLLTYFANNFDYYVTRIASIDGNTVILDERGAIVSGITNGQTLWNFYDDPTHPNDKGLTAIADYAYRTTATQITDGATHVLLGDSWFSLSGIKERLEMRFEGSTFVNKGIGGNTLCNLLARFDTDVPASSPQYVWINSGINDYYGNVSQEDYKLRLQDLISKVQAIGATAIVFDPSPLNNGSTPDGTSYLTLSQRYATQVLDLHAEASGSK